MVPVSTNDIGATIVGHLRRMRVLRMSVAGALAAIAIFSSGASGSDAVATEEDADSLGELLDRDGAAALEELAAARDADLGVLLGAFRFRDLGTWPPEQRARLAEAVRRGFPDTWQPDAGWCGNAYGRPANHSPVFGLVIDLEADAEPMLTDLLLDRDDVVRVNAAFVLRDALRFMPERRLALLAQAMGDDDPRVREVAAASIEAGCARGGLEVLREHRSDEDAFVRRRVAIAMASWGDRDAIPALIEAIGVTHCGLLECDDVRVYEQGESDSVLAALGSLTLARPGATDPQSSRGDGTAADKAAWTAWWSAEQASFETREAILALVSRMPRDDRPWLSARIVARFDDPEILEAIRADPRWRDRIGARVGDERAGLLDDEGLLRDPLATWPSPSLAKAFERLFSSNRAAAQRIVEEALASHDLARIGSMGMLTSWRQLVPQERWREALRHAAESPDAAWTPAAVYLLADVGTPADCDLIEGLDDRRLSVDLESRRLGCESPVPTAP